MGVRVCKVTRPARYGRTRLFKRDTFCAIYLHPDGVSGSAALTLQALFGFIQRRNSLCINACIPIYD